MKIRKIVPFLLLTLVSLGCFAQKTFEGVVTFNTTTASVKGESTVMFYMKDGRTRMEAPSSSDGSISPYSILFDEKGVDLISEGTITRIDNPKPYEGVRNAQLIGKVEGVSVNGFKCDKLTFNTGNGSITYWLSTEVPVLHSQLPIMIKDNMPQLLNDASGFPVKMEMTDATGSIIRTQNLVSVNVAAVSDSKFERK